MKNILAWGLAGLAYIFLFANYIPRGAEVLFGTIVAIACAGGVYITREWKQ